MNFIYLGLYHLQVFSLNVKKVWGGEKNSDPLIFSFLEINYSWSALPHSQMVRFKQLLKALFLTEEHIIHQACSPGNTYLLTGHFHLINDFTDGTDHSAKCFQHMARGIKCRPLLNKVSWLMGILRSTHDPENPSQRGSVNLICNDLGYQAQRDPSSNRLTDRFIYFKFVLFQLKNH